MINLQEVITKYPECLENADRLKAYLFDLYPDDTAEATIISSILSCGIADEIKTVSVVDEFLISQFCDRLERKYGYSMRLSRECVSIWCEVYGKKATAFEAAEVVRIADVLEIGNDCRLPPGNMLLRAFLYDSQKTHQGENVFSDEVSKIKRIVGNDADVYHKSLIEAAAISKSRAVGALEYFATAMKNREHDNSQSKILRSINKSTQYTRVQQLRNEYDYPALLQELNLPDNTSDQILEENYVRGLLIEEDIIVFLAKISGDKMYDSLCQTIDIKQALADFMNSISFSREGTIIVKEAWKYQKRDS